MMKNTSKFAYVAMAIDSYVAAWLTYLYIAIRVICLVIKMF